MGNMATENAAGARISSLLDAGSFVAVSYTHLDVYKRQSQAHPVPDRIH